MRRTMRWLPAGRRSTPAQYPGHLTNGRAQRCQSVVQSPNLLLTIAGRVADASKLQRPNAQSMRGMHDGCAFHRLGDGACSLHDLARRFVTPRARGNRRNRAAAEVIAQPG